MRIHRSFIINIEKIDKITDTQVFIGNKAITIGRSFKDNLIKRLPYI
ncbi:MAG: LytTR family transcriptional regulator DNA-binding domain-containing protein [Saprospiraceae bacterium]|nr:LytTR family transcriptional regulator DNA-binding domain-containing protein [Saprospiraceae bacterium]